MQAAKFRNTLTAIIQPGTPNGLLWPSESDYPIEVVTVPDSQVFGWTPTLNSDPVKFKGADEVVWETLVAPNTTLGQSPTQVKELLRCLMRPVIYTGSRVFRRTGQHPSEHYLYLLVRFGPQWIGLKCRLIET